MESLIIVAICHTETNAFNELAKLAAKNECHVQFSHFHLLGQESCLSLQINGHWGSIAKIENMLPVLAKQLNIEITFKRSNQEPTAKNYLPYVIEIIAADQPGLVYEINEFFNTQDISLQHWETHLMQYQQSAIIKISIRVDIPTDSNIADIREQFLMFCDELNLDGMMEPKI